MSLASKFRPAAERLYRFSQSPMGEEVMEGVLGGGMVGLGLAMTDQPIEQTALQTALAMAGGVGIGMGGRRLGAYIGKKVHPKAYENQNGFLSNYSRAFGQQGVFTGMKEGVGHAAGQMRQQLRRNAVDSLQSEFQRNPSVVAQKLGVQENQVEEVLDLIRKADSVVTADSVNAIDNQADALRQNANKMRGSNSSNADLNEIQDMAANAMNGFADMLQHEPTPITGEHTGRMLGRAWGDELGIATGLGAGALIGQEMGWESEKDRRIRELEEQLGIR